jgi:hypothetical protein
MRISKSRKETDAKSGNKNEYSTSQLFNFSRDSYLERTSRPICALVFLLPFIVFYEAGTFLINTDILNKSQIRVVAFVWLQSLLESLGFSGKFAWVAPPLAVIVILLALQISSGRQWKFFLSDFIPMSIECILLAVPLIVLTLFLNSAGSQSDVAWLNSNLEPDGMALSGCISLANGAIFMSAGPGAGLLGHTLLTNIVTGIGAGIYEELVFRLILICLLMLFFQDALGFSHKNSIVLSVLISAALFSAHHHIDFFSGRPNVVDPFNLVRFTFRTIAGIYFAALFAIRGFGITAGTHAFYNIIAVTITIQFFQH